MNHKAIYISFFSILLLICSASFILIEKHQEEKAAILSENKQLRFELNQLRSQSRYESTVELNIDQRNSFYSWPKQEKMAERMVVASDQQFKKEWALYLVKEAKKYDINPYLVFELLSVETGGTFDPKLVGPETIYGRAYGMSQFMKNTAPWIAEMAGLPYEEDLLFDPYYSIQLSLTYLDYLENRYGDWNKALTAYHRGMSGLETFIEAKGHAKSWYAKEILNNALQHQSLASIK